MKLMFSTNICNGALKFIMNSRIMKKSNFKIFKVMKSTSKTRFIHYLLSDTLRMSFEDLMLIFYI